MAKSRVKKRPDGRYAMQIYLGLKEGKRHYKTVYGSSPKEVQNKADDVRAALKKGLNICRKRYFRSVVTKIFKDEKRKHFKWSIPDLCICVRKVGTYI